MAQFDGHNLTSGIGDDSALNRMALLLALEEALVVV